MRRKYHSLPIIAATPVLLCVYIAFALCACARNQVDSDNSDNNSSSVIDSSVMPPAENVTPIEPNEPAKMWVVSCDDYLSLRTSPISTADCIAKIMDGDTVEAIGYEGSFAYVVYNGTKGYVLAGFLVEEGSQTYERDLSIVNVSACYSYSQMLADIETLEETYPGDLTVDSIGTSVEGRDIPVLVVGDSSAPIKWLSRHLYTVEST